MTVMDLNTIPRAGFQHDSDVSARSPQRAAVKMPAAAAPADNAFGRALLQLHANRPMQTTTAGRHQTTPPSVISLSQPAPPCLRKPSDEECIANRRVLPRRSGNCSVTFCISGDGPAEIRLEREWLLHAAQKNVGTLTDLSLTGIAFVCEHRVPVGATLLISISNKSLGCAVTVAGRVLRVSVEPDNKNRVICALNRRLAYPEYDSIGWSQMPRELV